MYDDTNDTSYTDTSGTGASGSDGGGWLNSLWGSIQQGAALAVPVVTAMQSKNTNTGVAGPVLVKPIGAVARPAASSNTMYYIMGAAAGLLVLVLLILRRK